MSTRDWKYMYTVLHMKFLTDWVNLFLDISYVFEVCELLCFHDAIHFDAVHHQWFFLKILRSFISIQIPGVALNWYFLKLSLWITNEPYACAQNIESMNQQKKIKNKKIQLQYIVVCIDKILRQTLNKTK